MSALATIFVCISVVPHAGPPAAAQGLQGQVLTLRPMDPPREQYLFLQVARDSMRDAQVLKGDTALGAWHEVAVVLQALLDMKDDVYFVEQAEKSRRWTTLKRTANRMLGEMSPAGRKTYENLVRARAAQALTDAKKAVSPGRLTDVAQRFAHTQAGAEAQLWVTAFALAGYSAPLPRPILRGTLIAAPAKADDWPPPQDGHAVVKFLPDQLWLKSDADEKKVRARLPLKSGFVVECVLSSVAEGPALQATASAVVIIDTPR